MCSKACIKMLDPFRMKSSAPAFCRQTSGITEGSLPRSCVRQQSFPRYKKPASFKRTGNSQQKKVFTRLFSSNSK